MKKKKLTANRYQIDQSGKVEQTSKPTILALSNGRQFSVLLKAGDKRIIQKTYRNLGKQRQYIYEVFSALLYILLTQTKPQSKVTIDIEYQGQQSLIKLLLFRYYAEHRQKPPSNLEFSLVGKSSPAHLLGYRVFKKKQKPSKTVTFDELVGILFHQKRPGIPVLVEPRALKRRMVTTGR